MTNLKDLFELFRSKSQGGKDFEDKHAVQTKGDANGNGDDVFKASKIKPIDRKKNRQGYNPGEDEKVYEEVENLDEADRGAPFKTAANKAKRDGDMTGYHKNMEKFHDHKETVASGNFGHRSKQAKMHADKASEHRAAWKSLAFNNEYHESYEISEDDIVDAISEMAEIAGVELTEEVFYELYEKLVTGNKTGVMRSKINAYGSSSPISALHGKNTGSAYIKDPTKTLHRIKQSSGTYDILNHLRQLKQNSDIETPENERIKSKSSINIGKHRVRDSFIEKYVKPSLVPAEQRIEEALAHLPQQHVSLILDLYEDLDETNKSILLKNLNDNDLINSFIDFAISNKD